MLWEETFTFQRLLLIYYWSASSMCHAVGPCLVHPENVVAAAGESVYLSCSANVVGVTVDSWQIGADSSKKIVVYTAPSYINNRSGTVAEGYSVDDTKENQAILRINSISLSQAGTYYCQCLDNDLSVASAAVVVLEPKFATNFSVCNGEPVNITCSISSSEGISYTLTIQDAYGNTVATKNDSSPCNDELTSCKLQYTITANSSVDQSFSCTVNATTNKNIPFSKVLNSSIENSKDCSEKCDSPRSNEDWNYKGILIPVACGIVIALVVASFLLFKYRGRRPSPLSQVAQKTIYALNQEFFQEAPNLQQPSNAKASKVSTELKLLMSYGYSGESEICV